MLLPSEGASFCKPYFSSCSLAEDSRTANTQNYYCLCMAKDNGDFIASKAFYIHEIGIGGSAPGSSSCVSSSPLLERDEEDPLREARSHEIFTAGKLSILNMAGHTEICKNMEQCKNCKPEQRRQGGSGHSGDRRSGQESDPGGFQMLKRVPRSLDVIPTYLGASECF